MNILTHKDIIDYWPTRAAFCAAVGVPYNIGRQWYKRSRIPADYWVAVVNACHEIDAPVTYRVLAECIAHKKTPSIAGKGFYP